MGIESFPGSPPTPDNEKKADRERAESEQGEAMQSFLIRQGIEKPSEQFQGKADFDRRERELREAMLPTAPTSEGEAPAHGEEEASTDGESGDSDAENNTTNEKREDAEEPFVQLKSWLAHAPQAFVEKVKEAIRSDRGNDPGATLEGEVVVDGETVTYRVKHINPEVVHGREHFNDPPIEHLILTPASESSDRREGEATHASIRVTLDESLQNESPDVKEKIGAAIADQIKKTAEGSAGTDELHGMVTIEDNGKQRRIGFRAEDGVLTIFDVERSRGRRSTRETPGRVEKGAKDRTPEHERPAPAAAETDRATFEETSDTGEKDEDSPVAEDPSKDPAGDEEKKEKPRLRREKLPTELEAVKKKIDRSGMKIRIAAADMRQLLSKIQYAAMSPRTGERAPITSGAHTLRDGTVLRFDIHSTAASQGARPQIERVVLTQSETPHIHTAESYQRSHEAAIAAYRRGEGYEGVYRVLAESAKTEERMRAAKHDAFRITGKGGVIHFDSRVMKSNEQIVKLKEAIARFTNFERDDAEHRRGSVVVDGEQIDFTIGEATDGSALEMRVRPAGKK